MGLKSTSLCYTNWPTESRRELSPQRHMGILCPHQPCPSANLQGLKLISGDGWNIPVANAFNRRTVFKKACTNFPLPLNSRVMSWGPLLRHASLYVMCFAYDLFPSADSELFVGQIHV